MTTQAKVPFDMKAWDEKPYHENEDGAKLTRANATFAYHGALEGTGMVEYLMAYSAAGVATIVGLERVVGRIGDRAGSFVFQHTGTDDGSTTHGNMVVVPDSGTGDLAGLRGTAKFVGTRDQQGYSITFDYDLS